MTMKNSQRLVHRHARHAHRHARHAHRHARHAHRPARHAHLQALRHIWCSNVNNELMFRVSITNPNIIIDDSECHMRLAKYDMSNYPSKLRGRLPPKGAQMRS